MNNILDTVSQIRERAENDLEVFIKLVHPQRVLGSVHRELIQWITRKDAKSHQLVLLPRDHQKSAIAGYYTAWVLTRDPSLRILYISATENLAQKQLKFIKDILTSPVYKRYWPEMIHPDEAKREKWTEWEISVDHPKRKQEAIRDPSIFIAGLTTVTTGLHCDMAILDDVIINDNAYTEQGRERVRSQLSLLSSVQGADASQLAVGTRYFPTDFYNDMMNMKIEIFNENGDLVSEEPLYEKFERAVEEGGQFLWPRAPRYDGKMFGFDANILAKKKAQYLDRVQFFAQYYNNPNSEENAPISRDLFQYYNKERVKKEGGYVTYNGKRLNVFAAIDFAFSLKKEADFTCIVVIGVDASSNIFVLDILRFKTDRIKTYFDSILEMHQKWGFRKIRAEVSVAQKIIVKDLKENYIRTMGLALAVDEFNPTSRMGSKEERIDATLRPRYENKLIWHYKGGNCDLLEDELIMARPPHDDIKDTLTAAVAIAVAPSGFVSNLLSSYQSLTNKRFGGIG